MMKFQNVLPKIDDKKNIFFFFGLPCMFNVTVHVCKCNTLFKDFFFGGGSNFFSSQIKNFMSPTALLIFLHYPLTGEIWSVL